MSFRSALRAEPVLATQIIITRKWSRTKIGGWGSIGPPIPCKYAVFPAISEGSPMIFGRFPRKSFCDGAHSWFRWQSVFALKGETYASFNVGAAVVVTGPRRSVCSWKECVCVAVNVG